MGLACEWSNDDVINQTEERVGCMVEGGIVLVAMANGGMF